MSVLYGCETWWSVALRECRLLSVWEQYLGDSLLVPKRDDVAGDRKLHNEELHNL